MRVPRITLDKLNSYNTSHFSRLDSTQSTDFRIEKWEKSARFLLSKFLSGRCAFFAFFVVEGRRSVKVIHHHSLFHATSLTVNRAIFSWTTIFPRSSPPVMRFLSLSFPVRGKEGNRRTSVPFSTGWINFFFPSSNYIYIYKFFSCYSLPFCIYADNDYISIPAPSSSHLIRKDKVLNCEFNGEI